MHDFAGYIGVPFVEKGRDRAGVDCWGLIVLALREQFDIAVPSHTEDYTTTHDHALLSALMSRESLDWIEVPMSDARTGDVVIIRIKGRPWHCGLVVQPPYFLHADRHVGVVKERWDSMLWARRVDALYRHPALMLSAVGRSVQ